MKMLSAGFVSRIVVCVCLAFMFSPLSLWAAESDNAPTKRALLVLIFDQNCKVWCSQVRPVVAELQKTYGDQVEFSEIDVTRSVLDQAKEKAKELRIGGYLGDTRDLVPLVMIFSANRHSFRELAGPKRPGVYEEQLKEILSKRG
jgi:hypothetical protein